MRAKNASKTRSKLWALTAKADINTGSKQAENELMGSEEGFRAIFESTRDCIFIKDIGLRHTLVNPSCEYYFGLPSSKVIGRVGEEIFGEEISAHMRDMDSRVLDGEVIDDEITFPVKGIPATFNIILVPMRDNSGQVIGVCGIVRDITKRKQAKKKLESTLKEKELLLREVHHRVKNNLQIISGLLDLSIMRTQNQEIINALQDSRSRIHTMSLIHEQLYKSERFDKVNMIKNIRELMDTQIAFYTHKGISIRPVIEGAEVYLTINQAIPCALVLNELVSNAFKHAFKERERGTITVSARRTADDSILIMVKDDGVGIPESVDINRLNTLGLKLVRNLVQNQLKGSIKVNRDNGTEIVLQFKTTQEGEIDA